MLARTTALSLLAAAWLVALIPPAVARTPAPTPTFGATVVIKPVSGTVRIKAPGARAFSRLRTARLVRVRTIVDAASGTARVTSAAGPATRRTQDARVSHGQFTVLQRRRDRGEVELGLLGGGVTCGRRDGPAGAQRTLRVSTRGRFGTRGCASRIRISPNQRSGRAQATTVSTSVWQVWEYPNGWRIRYRGTAWLEVTDLRTRQTQRVHRELLYEKIYEVRPVVPPGTPPAPAAPTTPPPAPAPAPQPNLDPLGDLLPCGLANCQDADLRSALVTVSGGNATFTVESYADFFNPPTLDFQVWTTGDPGTALGLLDGDYHVHICKPPQPCVPGTVDVLSFAGGTPTALAEDVGSWSLTTPTVASVTFPLSAINSPDTFQWAVGSETCGWRDKIPDTGALRHPPAAAARASVTTRRGPIARAAC